VEQAVQVCVRVACRHTPGSLHHDRLCDLDSAAHREVQGRAGLELRPVQPRSKAHTVCGGCVAGKARASVKEQQAGGRLPRAPVHTAAATHKCAR
jgi:hypothetical protein